MDNMDVVDIGDIEMKHQELSDHFENVVDKYKEALSSMQGDVQEVISGLFRALESQLESIESKSKGKTHSTHHRIKLLKSLHKSMVSMENAFSDLKGRYSTVINLEDDSVDEENGSYSVLSSSFDSEKHE